MHQSKVFFIIPGYKHKPENKAYREIAKALRKQGYHPVNIKIRWKKSTISENTRYFLQKFNQIKSRKKYILGFSFGAIIAFLASTKVRSSGVILCSLSPYFKQDLSSTNLYLGSPLRKQRFLDFSKLQNRILAKKIRTKNVIMLYGSKEEKSLRKRVNDTYKYIMSKNKHLISIEKTEHNIGDRRYLETIYQAAKFLN